MERGSFSSLLNDDQSRDFFRNRLEFGLFCSLVKTMSGKRSATLHPKNLHQGRYDFSLLCQQNPELKAFVIKNPRDEDTIDFTHPAAVVCLNQALLATYYRIKHWVIPPGYLCPPIPGRADYVHYAADLLADINPISKSGVSGMKVKVLDIGTGANLIYPIIGSQVYGWQFVASDIDPVSVKSAQAIVKSNPALSNKVRVVQQNDNRCYFRHVVKDSDRFALTLCNPPFHGSLAEAQAGTQRKWNSLNRSTVKRGSQGKAQRSSEKPVLNFGGQKSELWCDGGEIHFLTGMIRESNEFAEQVCWFTSLVSKKDNLIPLKKVLKQVGAKQIKVVEMAQGQKVSRLLAWRFMRFEEQYEKFRLKC